MVKDPNNLIITFDVNFKTQILTKSKQSKRFEDIHNLILTLHNQGLGNKEISNYLNPPQYQNPNRKKLHKTFNWNELLQIKKD